MSGDSQRNEESDFLDDDFVVEDIAGKNDSLDDLFVDPPAAAPAPASGEPDSDDVLFTDHTVGLNPSEQFQGKGAFAEGNRSDWGGAELELEEDAPAPQPASELEKAEDAFQEELGELLHAEEELGIGDQELELVDGPSAGDGISEIEQSGPFVLDEGDGVIEEAAAEAPLEEVGELSVGEVAEASEADPVEVAAGIWEAVKDPAMAEVAGDDAGDAVAEPGWEPLPEANVDELSEVDEVAAVADGEPAADEETLAAVDGHDIYSGEEAPVLVGPRPNRLRRASGVAAALAASLAFAGLGAVVVMRPEWIGLHLEPVTVQQVQLQRPQIAVAIAAPAPVAAPKPQVAVVDPPVTTPEPTPLVSTTPPVATEPTAPEPVEPYGPPPPPEAAPVVTSPVAQVAPTMDPTTGWPIASAPQPAAPPRVNTKDGRKKLVRVGDDTMLGELDGTVAEGPPRVTDGVVPGTRAFAQLQNGNFFIGSVKAKQDDQVTLRLPNGEVTIPADDLVRLTALGSADYDALQKATSGFVRLTNSNKLVGGILSQIADDHVVLEFRSNRVMLPKSVVGEVVQGEEELEVRLDVTREEDDWVKSLVERQIGGTYQAPQRAAPAPQGEGRPVRTGTPTPGK